MKRKPKPDLHRLRLAFVIERINEINEWRNEAIRGLAGEQAKRIDERAFQLREAAERS